MTVVGLEKMKARQTPEMQQRIKIRAGELGSNVALASDRCGTLKAKRVSPRCLRHTAAILHADMRIKEQAMERTKPVDAPSGRYRPSDELLAFLEDL